METPAEAAALSVLAQAAAAGRGIDDGNYKEPCETQARVAYCKQAWRIRATDEVATAVVPSAGQPAPQESGFRPWLACLRTFLFSSDWSLARGVEPQIQLGGFRGGLFLRVMGKNRAAPSLP